MALPLLILSFLTIFIAYKLYQRLRFKLPPGPRPLPIVGNLYDFKPVLIRCFQDWSKVYGPIISVFFGSQLSVIVHSPELAKQVLKDNDQQLAYRNRTRQIAKVSRNGMDLIWSDYGPHYVKVRKLCTLELFSMRRIDALRPIREDEVTAMIESIFKDCTKPGHHVDGVDLVKDFSWKMKLLKLYPFTPWGLSQIPCNPLGLNKYWCGMRADLLEKGKGRSDFFFLKFVFTVS